MKLAEEIILYHRTLRAHRAWVRGRLDGDTFDLIIARIQAKLDADED